MPQSYRAPGLLARLWGIAAQHRIVFFSGVPTVYPALLQQPPQRQDLSDLKYGVCGAAPLPVALFHRFQKETGVVLDDQGRWLHDAACDEVGVLAIRGPRLFQGYLHAAHNQGLWIERPNDRGEPERWLNTGDLGRQDAQAYFWLTGRMKELIIRGGHNIDPKLIEEALHAHPAVALAAAVGAALTLCEAVQDPREGAVVRWQAADRNDELSARLALYPFQQERTG